MEANIIEIYGHDFIEQPLIKIKGMLGAVGKEVYEKSKAYYDRKPITYYLDETGDKLYIKIPNGGYYIQMRYYLNMRWHLISKEEQEQVLSLLMEDENNDEHTGK